MKVKFLMSFIVFSIFAFCSCSDDDDVVLPSYSNITITPSKDVYEVGDVITCSITQKTPGGKDLLETSYWWYTSWWFSDPNFTADFQEFEDEICSSSEIVLTEAGDVTLYFFGQLKYPKWNWKKVEIPLKIKVKEKND